MNYIEVEFIVSPKIPGVDILISELAGLDFESFAENHSGTSAYITENNFNQKALYNLHILQNPDFKISWKIKTIPSQNWNAAWESNYEPIEIDDKCCIHAPFHSINKPFQHKIIIEPKMSFGTGHHATTVLMVKKLLTLHLKNKSVLDMGCGTGVLAILAAKQGAAKVLAIDIDDWAYENTLENLAANKITNVIVNKGDAKLLSGKSFNTILANINKNILLQDISIYAQALESKGNLLLSGFFETDMDALKAECSRHGLIFEDKLTENSWALLHFIKA